MMGAVVDIALLATGLCSLLGAMSLLLWMARDDLRSMSVSALGCYAFVTLCLLFQLCVGGLLQVLSGAVWSLVVIAACAVANAIHGYRVRVGGSFCSSVVADRSTDTFSIATSAIGSGDVLCMVGLCLASGQAVPFGAMCCFAAVGAFSLFSVASKRLKIGDAIPLVPFFFAWLIPAVATVILSRFL